jgi:hypothetical protein
MLNMPARHDHALAARVKKKTGTTAAPVHIGRLSLRANEPIDYSSALKLLWLNSCRFDDDRVRGDFVFDPRLELRRCHFHW